MSGGSLSGRRGAMRHAIELRGVALVEATT